MPENQEHEHPDTRIVAPTHQDDDEHEHEHEQAQAPDDPEHSDAPRHRRQENPADGPH